MFLKITEDNGYTELNTRTTRVTLLKREKLAEVIGGDQGMTYAQRHDGIALSFQFHDLDEACQHLKAKRISSITTSWSLPPVGNINRVLFAIPMET